MKQQGLPLVVKRLFDSIAAALGLVVTLPLLALAMLAIRFSLGRPIFFRQKRPGKNARPFELVKLRTMSDSRDEKGLPLPDSQRLNPTGAWLRSTSIDELPQLWNVLKGEMSLVGPRPLLTEYLERYNPKQARRHEVLPGITGWAQVNGRNSLDWDRKLALDTWYVDNWSLGLDFKILLMTASQVLRREGISNPDSATMPEFMGTSEKRLEEEFENALGNGTERKIGKELEKDSDEKPKGALKIEFGKELEKALEKAREKDLETEREKELGRTPEKELGKTPVKELEKEPEEELNIKSDGELGKAPENALEKSSGDNRRINLEKSPEDSLFENLKEAPEDNLQQNLEKSSEDRLSKNLEKSPEDSVSTNLEVPPEDTLPKKLEESPDDSLSKNLEKSPEDSVSTNLEVPPEDTPPKKLEESPEDSLSKNLEKSPEDSLRMNPEKSPDSMLPKKIEKRLQNPSIRDGTVSDRVARNVAAGLDSKGVEKEFPRKTRRQALEQTKKSGSEHRNPSLRQSEDSSQDNSEEARK